MSNVTINIAVNKYWRLLSFFAVFSLLSAVSQANTSINSVRIWPAPDKTRLVFDLNKPVKHKVFTLTNPHRVVIDFSQADIKFDSNRLALSDTPIRLVRTADQGKNNWRVVLDLSEQVNVSSFALKKEANAADRLVLDLKYLKGTQKKQSVVRSVDTQKKQKRDLIIAIDAGHGGEDPGALGPRKIREKHVVYAIAKKLAANFKNMKGYKPVMIRSGDYNVGLSQRRNLARKHKADLFISVHADAFTSPKAHGASVFALSTRGASSASAQFLADKENKSDLIGGVSIADKDPVLSKMLTEMSMDWKSNESEKVGSYVLAQMDKLTHLHSKRVGKAAFSVLKSPDIPSILVETGFISNPTDAKNLNSRTYQQKMANAISTGVSQYFKIHAHEGTYIYAQFASKRAKQYIVSSGDTLSGIASRFSISTRSLRQHNRLSSNVLKVGQKLKIPSI